MPGDLPVAGPGLDHLRGNSGRRDVPARFVQATGYGAGCGKGCIRLIKQAKGFYGRVGLGLPRTVRGQR
jgi:hypothetical protein